jgi:hypothetical protein
LIPSSCVGDKNRSQYGCEQRSPSARLAVYAPSNLHQNKYLQRKDWEPFYENDTNLRQRKFISASTGMR